MIIVVLDSYSQKVLRRYFQNLKMVRKTLLFLLRRVLNRIKDVSIWMVGKVSPSRAEVKVVSLFKLKPE